MWKPGQIVTIEHKKYRVKHGRVRHCRFCPDNKPGRFPTAVCVACYTNCGYYDYLEEIKPKRKAYASKTIEKATKKDAQ